MSELYKSKHGERRSCRTANSGPDFQDCLSNVGARYDYQLRQTQNKINDFRTTVRQLDEERDELEKCIQPVELRSGRANSFLAGTT